MDTTGIIITSTIVTCLIGVLSYVQARIRESVGSRAAGVQSVECRFQHEGIAREMKEMRETLKEITNLSRQLCETQRQIADTCRSQVELMREHQNHVLEQIKRISPHT